jgi:site-specific recombinase XerD
MSERGAPMSAVAFRRMVTRLGPAAKMPFGIHPHMLRHSTGFVSERNSGAAASPAAGRDRSI